MEATAAAQSNRRAPIFNLFFVVEQFEFELTDKELTRTKLSENLNLALVVRQAESWLQLLRNVYYSIVYRATLTFS